MTRVQLNGVALSVTDRGEGDAVVFVHGMMCSGRFFAPQVEYFSSRRRVVVPDLRGHGESDKPPGGHTVSAYADDLHALLAALDITRPEPAGGFDELHSPRPWRIHCTFPADSGGSGEREPIQGEG